MPIAISLTILACAVVVLYTSIRARLCTVCTLLERRIDEWYGKIDDILVEISVCVCQGEMEYENACTSEKNIRLGIRFPTSLFWLHTLCVWFWPRSITNRSGDLDDNIMCENTRTRRTMRKTFLLFHRKKKKIINNRIIK